MESVIRLREYQKAAKEVIFNDCVRHVSSSPLEERVLQLQAPTGSGKTLIIAKSVKNISAELGGKVAFIWLTIGDGNLANQSRNALKRHLNMSNVNVYSLDDALRACPVDMAGSIVVVNWEAINKEDKDGRPLNVAMMPGDRVNFPEMCVATRNNGTPIILIIDESHSHAATEKSKRIRQGVIAPSYTILASATPNVACDQHYRISYKEVAKSGMIKKNIITLEFSTHNDGFLMAAKKLNELIALAKSSGANFSPKMVVFMPNTSKNGDNEEMIDILSVAKNKFGWHEDYGGIKLWFSGTKSSNLEDCKENLNETKVIFTKEAIDTGVDIPSISVILQIRPTRNARTQVQKFGRGLRMPEQKHYGNDLDTLFIFAFSDFKNNIDWTDADYLKDELDKTVISVRPCFVDGLRDFPAIISENANGQESLINSLQEDFAAVVYPVLVEKIRTHSFNRSSEFKQSLGSFKLDYDSQELEQIGNTAHTPDNRDINIIYQFAMRDKLKQIYSRHSGCIEDAIDDGVGISGKREERQLLVLNNFELIDRLINEAIRECEEAREDVKTEESPFKAPPASYRFNGEATNMYFGCNFLYDKYRLDRAGNKSALETSFEEYLVGHHNVLWWCRNYERVEGSFCVVYVGLDGKKHNFYPDNIVALKDGRYLIVDTKDNDPNMESKMEALVKRLRGTEIIGGIVRSRDGYFYLNRGNGEVSLDDIIAPRTAERPK
jgi:type III restriction enzyme